MSIASHATPVIIGAGAVALSVVLRRRRRRTPPRAARRPGAPRPLAGVLGDTGLVAGREIRTRMRGRMFRVGTLLVLVAVAIGITLSTLGHHGRSVEKVGVVGVPAALRAATVSSGAHLGVTVHLLEEPSTAAARADLRSGKVALAVEGTRAVLVKRPLQANDTSTGAQLARQIAAQLGVAKAVAAAKLSATQIRELAQAKPLPIEGVTSGPKSTTQVASFIGLPVLLFMFIQYNTWTMVGVIEEKSSRVVEVLLATVRPIELLAGKVLGIGIVALTQGGLAIAVALGVGKATGSDLAKGTTLLFLLAILAWLILGYAFYSWVYAAAGSLAERQDQVQAIALPLSVPILIGYVIALTAQATGSASTLVKVLAYLPPTAPFAMPALVGLGAVTWWQFLASALLSLAGTVAVARLAATVYERAVLRTGRRVHLRELFGSRAA